MITKLESGKFRVDCRPWGRHNKRIRKIFITRHEAQRFLNHIIAEAQEKPWIAEKQDNRHLSTLIERWYELHGKNLTDPDRVRNKLNIICEGLEDPIAHSITPTDYVEFRTKRMDEDKIAPKTANIELSHLRSMFNRLIELGELNYPNPIATVKQLKLQETELAFLMEEDIKTLFRELKNSLNPDVYLVAKVCISVGARWSEIEQISGSQFHGGNGNYRVTLTKTKGKKNRTIPISKSLYNELPKKRGRLFSNCRKAFERAVDRSGIELPDGQCSHVLRHTFASHFMMNGGNILVLKEILGHADIKDTMRYAHFAPSHMDEAVKLNPISHLKNL